MLALKGEGVARAKLKGVNVVPEDSAKYDSRGNGLAEAGVKAVKDKIRTLISATNASSIARGSRPRATSREVLRLYAVARLSR